MKQPGTKLMKRVTSCLHVLAFTFNSQPTTGENSQWLISTAREKSSNAKGENSSAQQFDNESMDIHRLKYEPTRARAQTYKGVINKYGEGQN